VLAAFSETATPDTSETATDATHHHKLAVIEVLQCHVMHKVCGCFWIICQWEAVPQICGLVPEEHLIVPTQREKSLTSNISAAPQESECCHAALEYAAANRTDA
jgi:hypothetical protein